MPNPRGNPESLIPLTTHRKESCTANVTLRIPPSQKSKLQQIDNWQEVLRDYIQQITAPISA